MSLEVWFLSWNEGKTANFRLYFTKADAEMWARANQAKIGTNWTVIKGEIHGELPLYVCFDAASDANRHVIFTNKDEAEFWLQHNDSGRMDVRKYKVAEVF